LQLGYLGIDLYNDVLYFHEPSGIEDNPPAEFQCTLGLKTQARDCSPQLVKTSCFPVILHVLDQVRPWLTTKNISRAREGFGRNRYFNQSKRSWGCCKGRTSGSWWFRYLMRPQH